MPSGRPSFGLLLSVLVGVGQVTCAISVEQEFEWAKVLLFKDFDEMNLIDPS